MGIECLDIERLGIEHLGIERLGIERLGIEHLGIERLGIECLGIEQTNKDLSTQRSCKQRVAALVHGLGQAKWPILTIAFVGFKGKLH